MGQLGLPGRAAPLGDAGRLSPTRVDEDEGEVPRALRPGRAEPRLDVGRAVGLVREGVAAAGRPGRGLWALPPGNLGVRGEVVATWPEGLDGLRGEVAPPGLLGVRGEVAPPGLLGVRVPLPGLCGVRGGVALAGRVVVTRTPCAGRPTPGFVAAGCPGFAVGFAAVWLPVDGDAGWCAVGDAPVRPEACQPTFAPA